MKPGRLLLIFLLFWSPRYSPTAAHLITNYILARIELQQIVPWDPPAATADLWQIQVKCLVLTTINNWLMA